MKLSDLITLCKIKIPSIKTSGIDDTALTVIINEGVVQVNLLAKVYRGYTDFNITTNTQLYQVSTIAPTFQQIVTAGLWIKNTSTGKLVRVIPRTEEWLNKRIPTWRDASAASAAQYYYHEGDDLVIYPPISSNITNGGRLFHTIIPTSMSNGNHYPFTGTTTEKSAFRPLDLAIVEYVRWQVAQSLNTVTGENLSYPLFLQMVDWGRKQIKAKPDAINYYDTAVSFNT